MKLRMSSSQRGQSGLLDLLVMIIAVAAVVFVAYAYTHRPRRIMSSGINCVNNLKQVGLAFRLWAGDNNDKMPMQVSTNLGGTMEYVISGSVSPHFSVMSNELGTPKIVLCPADAKRTWATNFASLGDSNVSYFAAIEMEDVIPEMWGSGDRNLAAGGQPLKSGLFWMPTNRAMSWTSQIHNNKGNISLADGSVQQYSSAANLHKSATNALRAYYDATTNGTFRLAIP